MIALCLTGYIIINYLSKEKIMYHLGQKVRLKGEPHIFAGVSSLDFDDRLESSRGTLFIATGKRLVWIKSIMTGELTAYKDDKGEVIVGEFCEKTGLKGHFFGLINVDKLGDTEWELIEETLQSTI